MFVFWRIHGPPQMKTRREATVSIKPHGALEGRKRFLSWGSRSQSLAQYVDETATYIVLQEDPAVLLLVTRALSPSSVARNASASAFRFQGLSPTMRQGAASGG